MIQYFFFAVLFCILPFRLEAQSLSLLEEKKDEIFLGKISHYYEDKKGNLTPSEASVLLASRKFIRGDKDSYNFGFTKSVYWFHFQLENKGEIGLDYFLETAYPHLDNIEFYEKTQSILNASKEGKGYKLIAKAGDSLPFRDREVYHKNFIITVHLKPQTVKSFLIRIQTASSMLAPFTLHTAKGFAEQSVRENFLFGFYYGIMGVMLVYNLFLLGFIKDKNYLYYILYILAFSLFQLSLNGFAFMYLWPGLPLINNFALPISMCLGCLTILNFSMEFTALIKIAPLYYLAGRFIRILLTLLTVITIFIPYSTAIRIHTVITIFVALVTLSMGLRVQLAGYKPARYFLLAWGLLLTGGMITSLKALGFLPVNFITEYAIQIGSALEVVVLSFALADRINIMKEEMEMANLTTLKMQLDMLKNKEQLLGSFSRFVPKQFLHFLGKKSIEEINLGDSAELEMAILFSDIRSFTTLSESMGVYENFRFLNSYLKRMEPVIQKHNGFVDKFIGDAILSLYPNSCEDALLSAIEMQEELKVYNIHRSNNNYPPIHVGFGMHFGALMLGTVGSDSRIETTVIGDTVNLASRIESLTKVFQITMIVTDSVFKRIQNTENFYYREIDSVVVRGKMKPIVLYEIYNSDSEQSKEKKILTGPDLGVAMFQYKAGNFNEAKELFEKCHSINPNDHLPEIYIQRCIRLIQNPPTGKWVGVSRMK